VQRCGDNIFTSCLFRRNLSVYRNEAQLSSLKMPELSARIHRIFRSTKNHRMERQHYKFDLGDENVVLH
jgi:hypothetical protein